MTSSNSRIPSRIQLNRRLYYKFVPFKYRYSSVFNKYYNFLEKSTNWDLVKLKEYQNEEFLKLVKHCFQNVPYYQKLFSSHGITQKQIQTIEDINLIPTLNKDIIKKNFEDLQAVNFKNIKKYSQSTSGSTGDKLKFYVSDDVFKKEAAFILRYYRNTGANMYSQPSIWIRRYVPNSSSSPLWYYDYELKRLYMSAYHLNENTAKSYIDVINSLKASTLVTYPSSAYILALLSKKYNLKFRYISQIRVASEKIYDKWVDEIYKVFQIRPLSHYGQIEKVSFMNQVHGDLDYHINLEYGVTELEKKNGSAKILGTGFLNYSMPFLRYETNDTAVVKKDKNQLRIKDIEGRSSDILFTESGSLVPGVNFFSWIDKNIKGISIFQIIQKKDKTIDFIYVPEQDFIVDEIFILKGLKQRLGNLPINIIKKSQILRDKNIGKIRVIKNEIQI